MLRYGVIGLGFFGEKHAQVAAQLPGVELRAICTRRADRLREVQQKFQVPLAFQDYRELLSDPDIQAVSITTHVNDHAEPTIAALEAGKHVLLEKPLAGTLADCDRILAAALRSSGSLLVGHICRFNPRYQVARARIQAGELGQIVSLFARRNIPALRSESVLTKIGPILGDGVHDLDLFRWMTGAEITIAQALTHSVRDLPHPDLAWSQFRLSTGAIGVLENVWMLPVGTPFRIHEQLEIIGTEGALYLEGAEHNLSVHGAAGVACPDTSYWPEIDGQIGGALRAEIEYFVDCVTAGRTPDRISPADARAAVAAALAAEESARTGQPVSVPA